MKCLVAGLTFRLVSEVKLQRVLGDLLIFLKLGGENLLTQAGWHFANELKVIS